MTGAVVFRVIMFLFVAVILLVVMWNVIMKKGNEAHEAIEEEKKIFENRIRLPIQAQVYPGDLVKIVDNDMIHNEPKTYTFYYKLEPHKIGVGMYNNKYVITLDDQMYQTYAEVMGHGVAHNSRFASISEKFTITEVIDQLTNKKIPVESVSAFEKYLVEDTSTNYNNQVEIKEDN